MYGERVDKLKEEIAELQAQLTHAQQVINRLARGNMMLGCPRALEGYEEATRKFWANFGEYSPF